ncbi:MAG TPA: POTRA domain-containing protein [Alphaproteobacteria bacterium]|nr:POTRA domain-containing protein [Alphaproteobacteria bacterium]
MRTRAFLTAGLAFWASAAVAANGVPGPAGLQRLHDIIGANPKPVPVAELLTSEVPTPTTLGRSDIRFPLSSVEVRGVTLVQASQLKPIFDNLTGQESSLAEIDNVVAQINAVYQKNGFFLARALLPAQEISGGRVVIQVVEGKLERVVVQAPQSLQEKRLVKTLVDRLQNGPLTQDAVESALLRLNDVPGVAARGTFVPGSVSGTTQLVLDMQERKAIGELDFNNYGTKYLGPNQIQGAIAFANPLTNGADEITLQGVQTTDITGLTYGSVGWKMPVTPEFYVGANALAARSQPGWKLEDSGITGSSVGLGGRMGWVPIQRQRVRVEFGAAFDWLNAEGTAADAPLSRDRTRVAELFTSWRGRDGGMGSNDVTLRVRHGLDLDNPTRRGDIMASRTRGTGEGFTTFGFDASRLQTLNEYWGLLLATKGQFSTHALLAGEEFAFGGAQMGRGYPNQELLGDHGLAGTAELQLTFRPELRYLQTYQLFTFYDAGAVWNKDRVAGESVKPVTRVSGGLGVRAAIRPGLNGTVVLATPYSNTPSTSDKRNGTILFQLQKQFNVLADAKEQGK